MVDEKMKPLAKIRRLVFRLCSRYASDVPLDLHVSNTDSITLEDVLSLMLNSSNNAIHILQVGAYDGRTFDPIHNVAVFNEKIFLTLVEPRTQAVEALQRNYRDKANKQIIQAAIVQRDQKTGFRLYSFSDELININAEFGGKSSLNRDFLVNEFLRNEKTAPTGFNCSDHISAEDVRCVTVQELLSETRSETYEMLILDTEGWDWFILKDVFEAGLRPFAIAFKGRFLRGHIIEEALIALHAEGYVMRVLGTGIIGFRFGDGPERV